MSQEFQLLRCLRRVLESASEGKGMARAVVAELGGAPPLGTDAARMLLLGYPLRVSLRPLTESSSEESAMLASLIVTAPTSSAPLVGRSGELLAGTLERWAKSRENVRLEQKILRFRSLVMSGVLGAVTAMVASLGPIVGGLSFSGELNRVDPATLDGGALAMAAISSAVLGLYLGGKRFPMDVAVTAVVFALVSATVSPLAGLPPQLMWGVK